MCVSRIFVGGPEFHGRDFSGLDFDWVDLRGKRFYDCDWRNAKLVGTGVNIKGVSLRIGPSETELLRGLTIEERNVASLASAITFTDQEAQADTEDGLNTVMTPRQFLESFGIVVVPNVG